MSGPRRWCNKMAQHLHKKWQRYEEKPQHVTKIPGSSPGQRSKLQKSPVLISVSVYKKSCKNSKNNEDPGGPLLLLYFTVGVGAKIGRKMAPTQNPRR